MDCKRLLFFIAVFTTLSASAQDSLKQMKEVEIRDKRNGDFRSMNQV